MIGTIIDGKYRIDKLLGEGAMGSVYAAEHTTTGRRCAIKVISSLDLTRDPKVVQRFQREARAAGAIDTQHITQVLDAGVDRETRLPFLAMEFLAGEDLQHLLLRTGAIAPDAALRIAVHCCLGLMKAHEAGVVHRDIKPHNLFLARRDAGEIIVKLLDFGIAKVKMDQVNETEGADLTKTGSLVGSPLYMSPEQAVGQREIDHRTDIWSLGAVLYQALSGRTPYHDIKALGQLILAICSTPVPPLQSFAPWVPPEIAAIVHRCLEQDPARRFQSAQEMLSAIRPMLPYGWAIQEDMLGPLTEAHRAHVAPRFGMGNPQAWPGNPRAAMPSANASGGYPAADGSALRSGGYPAVDGSALRSGAYPAVAPAGTQGGLTASRPGGTARLGPSLAIALLAGIAGVGVLAGLGVFAAQRFAATPEATPTPEIVAPAPTASASQVAPPPVAPPVAVVEAPRETRPPPGDLAPRHVRVVIFPEDASVEVNGERASARNGVLEFSGRLGQQYKVRLFKGANEVLADVVVTEGGALPAKIELPVVPLRGAASAPRPSGSAPNATRPAGRQDFKHDTSEFTQ